MDTGVIGIYSLHYSTMIMCFLNSSFVSRFAFRVLRFAFRVIRFSFVFTTKGVPTEAFNLFCLKAIISRDRVLQMAQMSLTVTFGNYIQNVLFKIYFSFCHFQSKNDRRSNVNYCEY